MREVVATPAFHHCHHSADTEAIDKNFSVHTPIWDILFGTYCLPHRWPSRYGLGDGGKVPPTCIVTGSPVGATPALGASTHTGSHDMGRENDREAKANALTRRVDEFALSAGCELPRSVLVSLVRLFGEALDAQPANRDGTTWRDGEFTRCGAVDHTTAGTHPRCIRKCGHAGQHYAVTGEQWGDDNPAPDHASERLELLCFSAGCDAVRILWQILRPPFRAPAGLLRERRRTDQIL